MKPSITPGPWRVFAPHGELTIVDESNTIVARLDKWETPAAIAEMEANGEMLASSTDLYTACRRFLDLGKAGVDTSWHSDAVQDVLYAMMRACGRAEGRAL